MGARRQLYVRLKVEEGSRCPVLQGQRLLGKLESEDGIAFMCLPGCQVLSGRNGGREAGDGLLASGCEVCSQAELPDLVNSRKPCSVN